MIQLLNLKGSTAEFFIILKTSIKNGSNTLQNSNNAINVDNQESG